MSFPLTSNDQKKIIEEVVFIRRELHQIPETAFSEHKTSAYIQSYLRKHGVKFEKDVGKTGVLGDIQGEKSGPNDKKVVLLRADIDALPLTEQTGLDFASQNGKMHACGHDGHIAMLLVVSRLLSENKEKFSGKVIPIFQPAEEEIGGAKLIIQEKPDLIRNADYIFGFHIWNQIESGKIAINEKTVFVSADSFKIIIKGVGGHGAMPHSTIDPIYIGSNLIQASQSILSRKLKPGDLGVVTFGKFVGGTASNIIPDSVELEGTIRAGNQVNRQIIIETLRDLAVSLSKSFGASASFEIVSGTGPVVNNKKFSQEIAQLSAQLLGEESVTSVDPVSVADDVSEFMNLVPGVYALLGAAKKGAAMHHSPKFDFNESCLELGVRLMLSVVSEKLS